MKNKTNIEEYLSAHGIKKTPFRIELLLLFIENKHGLSHVEIQEKITVKKDKVTIYRALDSFIEKGLIHKVPDVNNVSKYALCPSKCSEKGHDHNHAHFICNQCHHTYCLDSVALPEIKNAKGFIIKKSKLTLEGDCPDCVSAKSS